MNKKLFAKLLLEHQNNLAEIRSIALKFIKYASEYVQGGDLVPVKIQKKTISREKIAELFLKTSALIIKLIPLEHQITGSKLIKKHEVTKFIADQEDELEISDEDIKLIKEFLKCYKK